MTTRKRKFVVEMAIPVGAQVADCTAYISDAVKSWAGSLRPPFSYGDEDPGDPMFGLDRESVRVTRLYQKVSPTTV